jgi:restriction system protein
VAEFRPMSAEAKLPSWKSLLWPTLEALRALGGSGSVQELEAKVAELQKFSDEQLAVLHKGGAYSEINYRLAWCRTYLKGVGAITNSSRGVWAITPAGQHLPESAMTNVEAQYKAFLKARKTSSETTLEVVSETPDNDEIGWKEQLLGILLDLSPAAFEHLAQRLLREAGFVQVEVTGKSGDEGIDGTGIYRPTLVSFPVFFQCKRHKGTVQASDVRDFRGAMVGRGDKGLFITTASFSSGALKESSRAGAPLIDLVDGDSLCLLLKQYGLGVKVSERVVEDVEIDAAFFGGIKP